MTEQNLSELETKILNCVHYSPHSMSVKPTQAIELIAYILASQAQPTPSQSDYERAELALFKEWFQSVQGIEYQGIYTFAHDAWMACAQLSKPQPTPSQSEIGAFAKAISKQAVEDYKASLVPAAYFLRESYDGTDEYNQTDPTFNKAMPLYELGETK